MGSSDLCSRAAATNALPQGTHSCLSPFSWRVPMHSHLGIKDPAAAVTAVVACVGLVLLVASAPAQAQYRIKNLVSNQVHQAPTIDPLVANPWGLARGPT